MDLLTHGFSGIFLILSVSGMYALCRKLCSKAVAAVASASLAAAFIQVLIQSGTPSWEHWGAATAVVWSLFFYVRSRYFLTALLSAAAVLLKEQALFLPLAMLVSELMETGITRPRRLVLFGFPVLYALLNPEVLSLVPGGMTAGASGLIAGGYRWLPVTAALAGMVKGRGRDTWSVPMVPVLLFPALFHPPEGLPLVILTVSVVIMHMIRERLYCTKLTWVFLLFPAFALLFFTGEKPLLLIPMVIAASAVMIQRYLGKQTAVVLGLVHLGAVLVSCF